MNYSYSISSKYNTVFIKVEGEARIKEFFSGIARTSGDPLYKPGMNFLADFTLLESYYLDYTAFLRFIDKLKVLRSLQGCRIACIVNMGVPMGYADMISVSMKGSSLEVAGFQHTCEASKFLGINCNNSNICSEMKNLSFSCTKETHNIICRKSKQRVF